MKKYEKLPILDIADYLTSEEDIKGFLNIAAESGDAAHIAHALGIATRARNMTKFAKKAGKNRANLYKALSKDGNPSFDTIMKVIGALGLKLRIA